MQGKEETLPTIAEALEKLITPGTVLEYPEEKIIFQESNQTVRSLEVNICSTESLDQVLLHKLHTQTRG